MKYDHLHCETRPLLLPEEKIELMIHLLRLPSLFVIGRQHIRFEHFSSQDRDLAFAWAAAVDLSDERGVEVLTNPRFREIYELELRRRTRDYACPLVEEEIASLLDPEAMDWSGTRSDDDHDDEDDDDDDDEEDDDDDDDEVDDEQDDDSRRFRPSGCLLDHVFTTAASDLNESDGRKLLQRFLEEAVYTSYAELVDHQRGEMPLNFAESLREISEKLKPVAALSSASCKSIGEEWEEHKRRQERYRGKRLIGLRTGIKQLDDHTLGLRGQIILASMPNVGKTALAIQVGMNVCQYHVENDATVVYLSLDMYRTEVFDRIHCNLAGLEWRTLLLGSPELIGRANGPWFNPGHCKHLQQADQLLKKYEIGKRFFVHDRTTLCDLTVEGVKASIESAKAKSGAKRALLIVDYLQLLPVPPDVADRGDLEADRYRVLFLQSMIATAGTDPLECPNTVLAISETRKPSNAKEDWGQSLSELMGSARLGYSADAVLLYRRMTPKDANKYYGEELEDTEGFFRALEEKGRSPVVLTLAKARDGMRRGEWGMEFDFRRSSFSGIDEGRYTAEMCREFDADSESD